MNEQELEGTLRNAPKPRAPRGLKEMLIEQARLAKRSDEPGIMQFQEGWLRRWWPVWASAAVSLVCAMVMAMQQQEIQQLKQPIPNAEPVMLHSVQEEIKAAPVANDSTESSSANEQQEITKLEEQKKQLTAEIAQLEQVQSQNQTLRAQLAAPTSGTFTPEEVASMQEAKDRAMRIACVNNLKQMGLAVRIWQADNGDLLPPDILSMSNELNTPKLLVCPADTNRPVATGWASYSDANCSYEFLAAAGGTNDEPLRVIFRCPIHGTVCLGDGSVQQLSAEGQAKCLVQRDGKLYFVPQQIRQQP